MVAGPGIVTLVTATSWYSWVRMTMGSATGVAMDKPRKYSDWRPNPDKRWRDAFHTFGHLLMTHARDGALRKVPEDASSEARELVEKAVVVGCPQFLYHLQ